MNCVALIPCFSDHFVFVSDFRQLSCQYFLELSHYFSIAAFCIWCNFNAQHSNQEHCEGESSSSAAVKSKVNADRNDQEVSDGFSNEGNIWSTITYCTKEQKLGSTAGATAVLRYPAILLPGALVPPGLLVSPSGFRAPCVLRVLSVVLLRI